MVLNLTIDFKNLKVIIIIILNVFLIIELFFLLGAHWVFFIFFTESNLKTSWFIWFSTKIFYLWVHCLLFIRLTDCDISFNVLRSRFILNIGINDLFWLIYTNATARDLRSLRSFCLLRFNSLFLICLLRIGFFHLGWIQYNRLVLNMLTLCLFLTVKYFAFNHNIFYKQSISLYKLASLI